MRLGPASLGKVDAVLYSELTNEVAVRDLLWQDASFIGFAIAAVFVVLIIHLRSLFMAVASLLLIMLSFPVTSLIIEYVFRMSYYQYLHAMLVFIVLGIATDDIFVFVDAWRQSGRIQEFKGNHAQMPLMRLGYTWRRAGRAMAVTSSTTAVAFLANAFSEIMPIKAVSIYAAVIICVNYFLIVLIMPSTLMFYKAYL